MTNTWPNIDSDSVGDPVCFLTLEQLKQKLDALPRSPGDVGEVVLVIRKGEHGRREVLDRGHLSADAGVAGDAWGRRPQRNPDTQIAVMEAEIARLIANGQPLTLFGDNLLLSLDLSAENLPVGSRVQIDSATLEVTPVPHNGCWKFLARFGQDALRFVSEKELRHRNLRGIYLRVVSAGEVRPGDPVKVLNRAHTSVPIEDNRGGMADEQSP